jgi:hypothetical protein
MGRGYIYVEGKIPAAQHTSCIAGRRVCPLDKRRHVHTPSTLTTGHLFT